MQSEFEELERLIAKKPLPVPSDALDARVHASLQQATDGKSASEAYFPRTKHPALAVQLVMVLFLSGCCFFAGLLVGRHRQGSPRDIAESSGVSPSQTFPPPPVLVPAESQLALNRMMGLQQEFETFLGERVQP